MWSEPVRYSDMTVVNFLGRRLHVLDLTRELAPEIPVYPGHMKVAMWTHLSHAESKLRIGDTPFRGYAVNGIALCDHDSTHIVCRLLLEKKQPDLTADAIPMELFFTEAVWIDLS